MKLKLKNMSYSFLMMLLAVGTFGKNYARMNIQDMQPVQDKIIAMQSPLHEIILNSRLSTQEKIQNIQDLLRSGLVDINAVDANGRTALNLATFYKAEPIIIQVLLAGKADVNKPDRFNETPLHNAIRYEEIIVAQMLLQAGANSELKNDREETPIDLARSPKTQALFGFDS